MRLILVITTSRKQVNFLKLSEATEQLGKKDTMLVSGTIERCAEARRTLALMGVKQSNILVDIKHKGTKHFVKEYINEYGNLTLIAENDMEIKLIKAMYKGKLKIVRI